MKKPFMGVFLISLATLMLEISLIKLFSIMQSYHFAFLIVSISMFGMAAAATFFYVKKLKNPLFISSILFSISLIIGFLILNKIPFDPVKASYNYWHALPLLLYYVLLGLPFFFFGIILTFVFTKYQKQSGKIYFYNLFGSALGSILALPLLALLGEKIITAIAAITIISSYFFTSKRNNALILLALIILIIPIQLNISDYKELKQALNYPNSELLETRWNSFSRVDLVNSSFTRYAPGLSSVYRKRLPGQIGILIDATDMNAITNYKDLDFINYLPTSIAYSLIEKPKTLIINSRAGLDIIAALQNNATITAVESNSLIIDLVNKYRDFSGNIYDKVNLVINQGRSHIKKADNYDIIILSLSGNVYGSGLYGLSQNYDLTKEAFQEYYKHLTNNGYLIITRYLSFPPRETLRLFSLALETTTKENIAMFRSWSTVTLVLGKDLQPEKILNFTEKNKFDIIYLPINFTPNKHAKFEEPIYYQAVNQILNNKTFHNNYLFDVTSVNDDRPFYFNFFKISKLKQLYSIIGKNWQPFNDPGFLLIFLLVQAIILSLIFILLPIKFSRALPKHNLLFFFFIGLAYLFVEIVFIQKFILLLNNITHSVAIVILSMLMFSSFGALVSNKFDLNRILRVIFVFILFYYFGLSWIINFLITLSSIHKIFLTILIISPLAFFMGMPFPIAIKLIEKQNVPWAFAINGSASVLSTILAIIIAMFFGYSFVLIIAGLLYLVSRGIIKE